MATAQGGRRGGRLLRPDRAGRRLRSWRHAHARPARRQRLDLNGRKMRITVGSVADVAVVCGPSHLSGVMLLALVRTGASGPTTAAAPGRVGRSITRSVGPVLHPPDSTPQEGQPPSPATLSTSTRRPPSGSSDTFNARNPGSANNNVVRSDTARGSLLLTAQKPPACRGRELQMITTPRSSAKSRFIQLCTGAPGPGSGQRGSSAAVDDVDALWKRRRGPLSVPSSLSSFPLQPLVELAHPPRRLKAP